MALPVELRTAHRYAQSVTSLGKMPKFNVFLRVKPTRRKLRSRCGDGVDTPVTEVLTPLLRRFSVNTNLLVYQFCTLRPYRTVQRRDRKRDCSPQRGGGVR